MGAIYFLFTVRSSSSRLGCGQKHKPVTVPELPGEAVATRTIDHQRHAPSALPPQGPHLPLGHETDARPASSPKSPRTGLSPYPETQRPARSAAQHSAQPRPGRLRRRLRPRRPGRAGERASARRAGRDEAPARPRTSSRPPATHVRRGGLPGAGRVRAAKCAQLTQLPERTGGRASERASGPRHQPGARRGKGPHLAQPRRTARNRTGLRPGALPKESPAARTRKRHSSPRPRTAAAAQGGPPRRSGPASWRAGARAQAVDRRNRRAQQPKELEPERAGPRRPSPPGQRPRRARSPPQRRSTCNGPPGFGEGRGAARGPHLGPGG